jgi:hypothetical protein
MPITEAMLSPNWAGSTSINCKFILLDAGTCQKVDTIPALASKQTNDGEAYLCIDGKISIRFKSA